ncbi:hypothetical protein BLOT_010976 [Blomia tropicalis]|nr:hypothetical protein BLOT_010976 [Blomia tropicalis]
MGETHYLYDNVFNLTNNNNNDYYENNEQDRVLVLRPSEESRHDHHVTFSLTSPTFTSSDYELEFNVNKNFLGNIFVIVIDGNTESQILKIVGDRDQKWNKYSIKLPKYISKMNVAIEIKFESDHINFDSDYIAFNNLNIIDKRIATIDRCDYRCESGSKCLPNENVCDTVSDCPRGDDEEQNCDKLPPGSYCSFKENFCHWFNYDNINSTGQWIHVQGSSATDRYLGVSFKGAHRFGSISYLKSATFDPIPLYHSIVSSKYYKSCKARFSFRFGSSSSDLSLDLEPQIENEKSQSIQVWRRFNRNKSFKWENVTVTLPINVHRKYRLKFGAAIGLKSFSTFSQKISVAIDSFSLTKECFAIDVPTNEPRYPAFIPSQMKGMPFVVPRNKTIKSFLFKSCGAIGSSGPTYSQCESFYLNSSTRAAVFENENLNLNGSQMWTVPKSAYYTIFAKGADGGSGVHHHRGGKGALVRSVFYLQEGDTIFIAIGQSGSDACSNYTLDMELCRHSNTTDSIEGKQMDNNGKANGKMIEVGGGGGGATYVFKFKPHFPEKWVPLLIAGGGGGGSGKSNPDFKYSKNQHGQGFDLYNVGSAGSGDGSGGGWNHSRTAIHSNHHRDQNQTGKSLLLGGEGGQPCKRLFKWHTNGGFGGGGGGCQTGGGGGGFHGGNANKVSEAGDGGTSFVDFEHSNLQLFSEFEDLKDLDRGPKEDGLVLVIPQLDNCCNDGRNPCLLVGETLNGTQMRQCICGPDNFMHDNCVYERSFFLTLLWVTLSCILIIFLIFFIPFIFIQKRSAKQKHLQRDDSNDLRLLSASSTDVQLSRLRNHHILTEYNPNYEFGGSTCTLQDLREIPREHLTLVRALGQGAFGEVYQGYLHNQPDEDNTELPVAVKTLPEYSANKQAEMDFLMEALIMSKFNNKNIVRFIGICFEKMPRFIVLELLPGGDLKTFLRENRSTIDSPSSLVMGDLLTIALDVASGCRYLEEHHFIHRDIAARNCLLTRKVKLAPSPDSNQTNQVLLSDGTVLPFDTKEYSNGFHNSGIIVKIADFGMARDIYRADYYRKGGKAMLPVKWMPPEAFLDGVFTSKTDVWSFGVLLWEVMSMGYMPYPGRGNQEVMQLVTAGGRLEPPNSSTPPQVYGIMSQCWNVTPELRPNFATIIERIGYCLQDPDVLSVILPVFHRSASVEKDFCSTPPLRYMHVHITLMRPPPDAIDYLVPNNPGSQTNSNYSMGTDKSDLLSPDTCSTLSCGVGEEPKLVEIDETHHHHQQQQHHHSSNHLRQSTSIPPAPLPPNSLKLWNTELITAQMIPYNVHGIDQSVNMINTNYSNENGIILNASNLPYQQHQQQQQQPQQTQASQPCVRYVNVSVANRNQLFDVCASLTDTTASTSNNAIHIMEVLPQTTLNSTINHSDVDKVLNC